MDECAITVALAYSCELDTKKQVTNSESMLYVELKNDLQGFLWKSKFQGMGGAYLVVRTGHSAETPGQRMLLIR